MLLRLLYTILTWFVEIVIFFVCVRFLNWLTCLNNFKIGWEICVLLSISWYLVIYYLFGGWWILVFLFLPILDCKWPWSFEQICGWNWKECEGPFCWCWTGSEEPRWWIYMHYMFFKFKLKIVHLYCSLFSRGWKWFACYYIWWNWCYL
jgi:hypothetical protein